MRYLKKFESIDDYESWKDDIRDCFLSVSDMVHIKETESLKGPKKGSICELSIGLSDRITPDESGLSKWGVKYREVINGGEIAFEIANSISVCLGLGIKIQCASVSWLNAGEWKLTNPNKEGLGPGLLQKIFYNNGKTNVPIDGVSKERYSIEILPEFIIAKGTRLRHIKLVFEK